MLRESENLYPGFSHLPPLAKYSTIMQSNDLFTCVASTAFNMYKRRETFI